MDNFKIPESFIDEEDARKKARETLAKTFQSKMVNIDNIKNIINEFRRLENQNSLEVFNRIERNINESEVSAAKISTIIENITEIEKSLSNTSQNWQDITKTLNHYGKNLEKLMLSKKNISMLIHNLNMYVQIKDQVTELESLMEKDENIVHVFKNVRYLTYLRDILIEKVKGTRDDRSEKVNNLADHLMCVGKFSEIFYEKFWKYFENTFELACNNPEFLVKLLRLIEEDPDYMKALKNQFSIYNKSEEKYKGIEHESIKPITRESRLDGLEDESLSETLIKRINNFIDERMHDLFFDKTELQQITEISVVLMNELYTIQTKVVPCFPPKYNILNVYLDKYVAHVHNKLKPFLDENVLKETPGLGIVLASFLDKFESAMQKIGVNIYESEIKSDISFAMHHFYEHTNQVLGDCFERIVNIDAQNKNKIREEKTHYSKINSTYPQDIFTVIYNEINLLAGDIKGEILYQIIKFALERLNYIQQFQIKNLQALYHADDIVIAGIYINDADNSSVVMGEYKKFVKEKLNKEFHKWVKSYIGNCNNSFNLTVREGCKKLIELLFIRIEAELLRKLFTKSWEPEIAMGVFDTFQEFFNNLVVKFIKNENILVIVVRTFIDDYVNYYIEEIIHTVRSVKKSEIKKKNNDFINLEKYQFKFLKCYEVDEKGEVKYPEKTGNVEENKMDLLYGQVKNLDIKDEDVKKGAGKKYSFPIKKLTKEEKKINTIQFCEKFSKDIETFNLFTSSFREDSKTPFSQAANIVLGQNFISTYLHKFNAILKILKCTDKSLPGEITGTFKESFSGNDGKVLLESLLCLREDSKVLEKDTKKYYLDLVRKMNG